MTLADWDKEAEQMTNDELTERIQALDKLADWPTFKREFKGFGLFTLRYTLDNERTVRSVRYPHRDAQIRLQRSRKETA